MKLSKAFFTGKSLVIIGYILIVTVMVIGLWAVYRNLVDFSEKRVRSEDQHELIVVGNIINQLYEVESSQNLFTYENAETYFERYNLVRADIDLRLDTLKSFSKDSLRIVKLDSIRMLLDKKEENLQAILVLMDSVRKAPSIIRETVHSPASRRVNTDIQKYLENHNRAASEISGSDTTVIKQKRKGLFRRIGEAFSGKQDSTVIIQNRQPVRSELKLAIDTVVYMVRYSERLNLKKQQKFRAALLQRQHSMDYTNRILTLKIDDLLKGIEKEEIDKSLKLIKEKNAALSNSYAIVFGVSSLAVLIAVFFGLLFFMDINRSQRYKKRLEKSYRQINRLLKSRERFMFSISHDIKAPMSSILGYLELIESGMEMDDSTRRIYLSNMKKSSDHVLQLVTNLLDYQKIETGTWSRKEMNFNLLDLCENTAKSFKPIAEKKQLSYFVYSKIPEQLLAFGDPFMIRQIYSNLISNAIKYTHEGKVEVFSESATANGGTLLKLSVRDTGIGINEEHREFVFHEFAQIKPDKNEPVVEGNGLGLAITKGLVEQLNGRIDFRSKKGEGSEFFVELPLETPHPADNSELDAELLDFKIENLSALVVDDDPIQLTMMSEMLKLKKINVVTEVDAQNVLPILKNNSFDVIFLDIQMPAMNGFTLVRKILDSNFSHLKSTAIIALSAKSDVSKGHFKQSGFTDFLNKPFKSSELFALIEKYSKSKLPETTEQNSRSAGVAALIDAVKEDRESSLEILAAFVQDGSTNLVELQKSFDAGDGHRISLLAHKMLPLFKMMGNENLSAVLERMERKETVSGIEKRETLRRMKEYVNEAQKMISEIEHS